MQAPLPVDPYLAQILQEVQSRGRAVIVAPPGAGKTTRIPPALATLGRTILLQPRRIAARALARRIASENGWQIGDQVGWQIRFERRFTESTRLLVATEGILTARLQSDPLLSDFSIVILDEFHERSLHADLALSLVREAAESRDDLALVVMSATIDPEPVARFLDASVIRIEARTHPIEIDYLPDLTPSQAIRRVAPSAKGHLLCFLPGAREIERTRVELADFPNVLPLHGSLDVEAQERAIAPSNVQKIVLSTNVAETSLTVDGVTDVIDTGLQKVLRFDPDTSIDHLRLEQISLDSADQRAGRAGRTQPGRATRLWDRRMLLRPQREPEILRVDLASAILEICAWGGDPHTFRWFERPESHRIDQAVDLLRRLGAVTLEATDDHISARPLITPLGRLMSRFPLHPRLARLLIAAAGSTEATRACALLSEDARGAGAGDVLSVAASSRFDRTASELGRTAKRILGGDARATVSEETLRRAVLAGYPDRVAMRREPDSPRLLLSSGTGATLGRDGALHPGEFLVALDVAGGGEESLVRLSSHIERAWLEPTHHDVEHTMGNSGVKASRRSWYGAILLHETPVAPDPSEQARLAGQALRKRVDPTLERRLAFARIEIDWDALITRTGTLQLPFDIQRSLDRFAPERLDLPSGRSVMLDYRDDGNVVASAKLQELFGLAESPLIGPSRTPVTFALLAPNGRPVQITRDLRSFWNSGYHEVRKELRARYPKHPWPDDPWSATPTHRTKRK
ncbi:MAG TPA: ATP-dependent helicase C-terminal domain-containing protein [Thermoanaerobaculia bacterium]